MAVDVAAVPTRAAAERRRRWWIDALIASLLAAASYRLGVHYVRTAVAAGLKPAFYQFEFGPAVMLACGHGFVSPAERQAAVLDQFLNLERQSMQCTDLSPQPLLRPLTNMQYTWKYLLWSTSGIWAIWGISWDHLVVFGSALFGATVAMAFALTRVVAGPIGASAVALAVMLSPLHWSQIPHFRDYSKAPFMLGLIALTALVARGPVRPRRLTALAAVFGLVLGIGTGFRGDLLIAFPAFIVAVLAFMPGGLGRHLKLKAAALAVAMLGFSISAWPLLRVYSGGAAMQVLALLGFVTPFDQALEVDRGPYEFGYIYSDWYLGAVVRDYARREQQVAEPVPLYRSVYNGAATGVLNEVVKMWPADIVIRAYASTLGIARLPVSSWTDSHAPPLLPADDPWSRVFEARARMLGHAQWVWPSAVVAALLVASIVDLRLAMFATILLLYFAGYPAVQYHERHFFHLNVVPLVALAFLAGQLWTLIRAGGRIGLTRRRAAAAAGRAAAFAAVVLLLAVLPLATLRAYQSAHLRGEINARLLARRAAVRLSPQIVGDHRLVFEAETLPALRSAQLHAGTVTSEYLIVRVGGPRCEALRLPLTFRYHAPFPRGDLSYTQSIALATDPADVQVLAPVFYRYQLGTDAADFTDRFSAYQFRGFEVDPRDRECLQGAERLVDTSGFPLLLSATLFPGWDRAKLYQTLTRVEPSRASDALRTFTAPADLRVTREALTSHQQPLTINGRAEALQAAGSGRWRMDGAGGIGAIGRFAYLLTAHPRPTAAGDRLIVEGVMHGGGLTVGLIRDGQWLLQTPVVGAGPFLAVVEVPSDGVCSVVIANNLPEGTLANHFEIVRAGWLPQPAQERP